MDPWDGFFLGIGKLVAIAAVALLALYILGPLAASRRTDEGVEDDFAQEEETRPYVFVFGDVAHVGDVRDPYREPHVGGESSTWSSVNGDSDQALEGARRRELERELAHERESRYGLATQLQEAWIRMHAAEARVRDVDAGQKVDAREKPTDPRVDQRKGEADAGLLVCTEFTTAPRDEASR